MWHHINYVYYIEMYTMHVIMFIYNSAILHNTGSNTIKVSPVSVIEDNIFIVFF